MDLVEFDYALPRTAIAQTPEASRDASRLLVIDRTRGALDDRAFSELPDLLRRGDCMVVNNSRVIPARVLARDRGGRPVELLFFARADGPRLVECLDGTIEDLMGAHGLPPLPPYIERFAAPTADDRERYQTVYAGPPGSVAAPTAGLHFTRAVLDRLRARGLEIHELTLHVGPGTFRPMRAATVEGHRMPPERVSIPPAVADAVNRARVEGRRVLAVGTTTTRALESAAQADGRVRPLEGDAGVYITPGFRFRVVDALLTNFHLPRSSLLVLVAAFAGRELILKAYAHAVRAGYRFYSYGDACLLL